MAGQGTVAAAQRVGHGIVRPIDRELYAPLAQQVLEVLRYNRKS